MNEEQGEFQGLLNGGYINRYFNELDLDSKIEELYKKIDNLTFGWVTITLLNYKEIEKPRRVLLELIGQKYSDKEIAYMTNVTIVGVEGQSFSSMFIFLDPPTKQELINLCNRAIKQFHSSATTGQKDIII